MCFRTIKTKICYWDEGEVRNRSFIQLLLLLQILNFLFDPTMKMVRWCLKRETLNYYIETTRVIRLYTKIFKKGLIETTFFMPVVSILTLESRPPAWNMHVWHIVSRTNWKLSSYHAASSGTPMGFYLESACRWWKHVPVHTRVGRRRGRGLLARCSDDKFLHVRSCPELHARFVTAWSTATENRQSVIHEYVFALTSLLSDLSSLSQSITIFCPTMTK